MNHLNRFGDCLKDLMQNYDLTIKELAASTGIAPSGIYDYVKKHIYRRSKTL